jgi:hypothetical protein
MFRLLLFMHHIAFSPLALHLVDLDSCMRICDISRGARTRDQKGVNPRGVERSTSAKCEDTNIAFRSRQTPVHLTNALVFYFKDLLSVLLDCALSL